MSNHIWTLTAPDGRVVGASARSMWSALNEGMGRVGNTAIWLGMCEAIRTDPTAALYEAAGYVLARGEVAANA